MGYVILNNGVKTQTPSSRTPNNKSNFIVSLHAQEESREYIHRFNHATKAVLLL